MIERTPSTQPGVSLSLQEIMKARGPGSLWQIYQDQNQRFLNHWYRTHSEEPTKKDLRAWVLNNLRIEHLENCSTIDYN